MLLPLYRGATVLGAPLVEAHLRRRAGRGKEDPARLPERLGRSALPRPAGPLVWLHGASVGESLSVLPLLNALLDARPDLEALVTTGTVTSARLMAERLPAARARHQFAPVDLPAALRAFLDHWRPDLLLLIESELWPNLLLETHARGAPIALVNARMSPRSFARWRRAPRSAARLLGCAALCLAQSEDDGERLRALGAERVAVTGNLKRAAAPLPADPAALEALRTATAGRTVWLAASTHPGEEEQVAGVHRGLAGRFPGLLTVVAPRRAARATGSAGSGAAARLRLPVTSTVGAPSARSRSPSASLWARQSVVQPSRRLAVRGARRQRAKERGDMRALTRTIGAPRACVSRRRLGHSSDSISSSRSGRQWARKGRSAAGRSTGANW